MGFEVRTVELLFILQDIVISSLIYGSSYLAEAVGRSGFRADAEQIMQVR